MPTDTDPYVVTVDRVVPFPPDAVFALLSDPGRHPELDGSGTLVEVRASEVPLAVGSHFDMRMKRGFAYSTRNTVTALEPDRRLTWSTRPTTFPLSLLIGGRTWDYTLTPEGEGTRVSETWDLRRERNRRLVARLAGSPVADMTATLERLEQVLRS